MVVGIIFLASSLGLAMTDKYYQPSTDTSMGNVTNFPKGHVATVDHTPLLLTQRDKQGMPWFESTLNPKNVRRENPDKGNFFSEHIFMKKT